MKVIKSIMYACSGIRYCFKYELNFRIHFIATIVVLALAFLLQVSLAEWLILLLCIGLVIVLEAVNTAIEKLCDLVHKEYHPQIKIIKDIAAGAVLMGAIVSAVAGSLIFLPKIIHLIKL